MQHRLLIQLDCLLDTRLAIISKCNPMVAKEIVQSAELLSKYRTRVSDLMDDIHPGIDRDQFQRLYQNRDVETLMVSGPTELQFLLGVMIADMEKEANKGSPLITGVEIDVNVWPYKLNQEEKDMIAAAVTARAGIETPVRTVEIPTRELTSFFIKERGWIAIIHYSLEEWIKETFVHYDPDNPPTCIPNVNFITPRLLMKTDGIENTSERLSPTGKPIDPFDSIRWWLSKLIGISFTEIGAFSIMDFREISHVDDVF